MHESGETSASNPESGRSLAVTLSGGGHRATLFGLGTLIYLADAGTNRHVTSMASVSGGSLTNGFVGQTLDYQDASGEEFRAQVASPLASQIAERGTLFAPLVTKIYLAGLVLAFLLIFVPFVTFPGPGYLRVPVSLGLLVIWSWLLGKRGSMCAYAFQRTLFTVRGRKTELRDIKRKVDHVICATELRAAEQIYFSGDFVYSYWLGRGVPADLALARAVQASAGFPGGFPPARLPTRRHGFKFAPTKGNGPPKPPRQMVMLDGGVYDNMGEQWARGFERRAKRWKELQDRRAPKRMAVVNAAARVPWSPFRKSRIPLWGEIAALLRVMDVMYVNTTNVRRQEIVESFDPLDPHEHSGLQAVLIQIAQSPFVVATAFAGEHRCEPAERNPSNARDRAWDVLDLLGDTREEWKKIAQDNAAVGTTLGALGRNVSARLMYHAYVVTMCNLYVLFGEDFPLQRPIPELDGFLALTK